MPRGRSPANVEFLKLLFDLSGLESHGEFAKSAGKTRANMSNYLSGRLVPGKRVLRDCVEGVFSWGITPIREVQKIPRNLNSLSTAAGIYILYDSAGNVLYVGQATNFRAEVRQTLRRHIPLGMRFGPALKKQKPRIKDLTTHLSMYAIPSPRLRHNIEALLLRVFVNQTHNVNIGKFR